MKNERLDSMLDSSVVPSVLFESSPDVGSEQGRRESHDSLRLYFFLGIRNVQFNA